MPGKRIQREKKTIRAMFSIHCKSNHGTKGELCNECADLRSYAEEKLDKCPFQEKKTPCSDCIIHCYGEPMRTKVKEVMRFSGPRMLSRHPCLAIMHMVDGRRSTKIKKDGTRDE